MKYLKKFLVNIPLIIVIVTRNIEFVSSTLLQHKNSRERIPQTIEWFLQQRVIEIYIVLSSFRSSIQARPTMHTNTVFFVLGNNNLVSKYFYNI